MAHPALAGVPTWFLPSGDFHEFCSFEPWPAQRFELTQRLATAIHGEVWLAEDRGGPNPGPCVVKKMPTARVLQLTGERFLEDALVEMGVSAFLQKSRSPAGVPDAGTGVVEMRNVFQDATFTYFVSELAAGGELFNHVKDQVRFPEERARQYAAQLIRATAALHAMGVAHRDISLENVLLHGDGTCRVVDFGQAVPVQKSTGELATCASRAGKKAYQAPEMFLGPYDPRPADAFALGVLLFTMVVGSAPWSQALPTDKCWRFIQTHGVAALITAWNQGMPPASRIPELSADLLDLLARLMATRPEDRPALADCLSHAWFAQM
jgi:serine/threonine protein kinase